MAILPPSILQILHLSDVLLNAVIIFTFFVFKRIKLNFSSLKSYTFISYAFLCLMHFIFDTSSTYNNKSFYNIIDLVLVFNVLEVLS